MDGFAFPNGITSFEASRQIRFMTAGSVDDGKSTLIGRLLLDAGALMRDQAAGLEGDEADLAALTDGLEAERAQGITIDVAYRYFSTPAVSFVIADAPGHEQYTRNMVTAASVSDVAVIVIDAAGVSNGALKPQTRRHAAIAALMGLDVIVAVNKMDAFGWSQQRFDDVRSAFDDVAGTLELRDVRYVPVSAKNGDNVVSVGGASWWTGPSLLDLIGKSRAMAASSLGPLRLPIQSMLRDGLRRYYAGRVESGVLRPGDKVVVGRQAHPATIVQVRVGGRGVASAQAGVSVAVELAEERDVARGDVIATPGVSYVRSVVADLCWLDETAWRKGRRYILRQGTLETPALIEAVNFVRVIEDLSERDADGLALNDIGSVRVTTQDAILADLYTDVPGAGAFVLFDPQTHQTCAAGMIREGLT
jgi:sulfate adenylyltransferase subunit 1